MAEVRPVVPALLVVAAFSRHPEALAWGRERLEQQYGPIGLAGDPFLFHHTTYYDSTMGPDLHKQLFAFHRLVDPASLPDLKRFTNALEEELAALAVYLQGSTRN